MEVGKDIQGVLRVALVLTIVSCVAAVMALSLSGWTFFVSRHAYSHLIAAQEIPKVTHLPLDKSPIEALFVICVVFGVTTLLVALWFTYNFGKLIVLRQKLKRRYLSTYKN